MGIALNLYIAFSNVDASTILIILHIFKSGSVAFFIDCFGSLGCFVFPHDFRVVLFYCKKMPLGF